MPTQLTFESTRFGTVEVDDNAIIEFPAGLIGLDSARWALIASDDESPFAWLHSVERADLALPVTNPWLFFADFELELSDSDSEALGTEDPDDVEVLVTVRASGEINEFSANLRAPIVVFEGQGHQVINEARHAPVRAQLFPGQAAEQAA
jgi:flagellar assembly factor FliW